MTLKQLYYFKKLTELQNYTKTAQALYITQPSLSATIHELEKELSVHLFTKSGKKGQISLSPAGLLFAAHITEALNKIEEAQSAVAQYVAAQSNLLRIGFIHAAYSSTLYQLFENKINLPADSTVEIKQEIFNVEAEMIEQLRLQNLNFAFSLNIPKGIDGFPFFHQELYIVVSKSHPLANKGHISFDEIKKEAYVEVRHATTINQVVHNTFLEHRCEPRVSAYAGNLYVAVTYVLNDNCYTVAPKLSNMDYSRLAFLTIDQHPMSRPIYFSWKANRVFLEQEQKFYDYVKTAATPDVI